MPFLQQDLDGKRSKIDSCVLSTFDCSIVYRSAGDRSSGNTIAGNETAEEAGPAIGATPLAIYANGARCSSLMSDVIMSGAQRAADSMISPTISSSASTNGGPLGTGGGGGGGGRGGRRRSSSSVVVMASAAGGCDLEPLVGQVVQLLKSLARHYNLTGGCHFRLQTT